MATLRRSRASLRILPSTADEQELVQSAKHRGQLVLDNGIYRVVGDAVILPSGVAETHARRLLGIFERAARDHAHAMRLRQDFRLVT